MPTLRPLRRGPLAAAWIVLVTLAQSCASAPDGSETPPIETEPPSLTRDSPDLPIVQGTSLALDESGVFRVSCPRSCDELAAIARSWSADPTDADSAQSVPRFTDERGVIQVLKYSQFKTTGHRVGDGTDDSLAIQAAIHAAAGGPVYFGEANYAVCCPITAPAGLPVVLSGPDAAFSYNKTSGLPATLWAAYSFPAQTAMLDLRAHTNVSVRSLGFTMPAEDDLNAPGSSYAIELGVRTGSQMYPNHHIEGCSVFGGAAGIRARNAGIMRIRNNNFSNQTKASLWLEEFCGDSEIEGNYVNSNNRNQTSGATLDGTGIYLGHGCGNTNIHGGKIEHNSYGIEMYMSGGVNISGVNFDYNTFGHISIQDAADDSSTPVKSINIMGNRFLAGGFEGASGQSHIFIQSYAKKDSINNRMFANIAGNSFRRGNGDAYDNAGEGEPRSGPTGSVIRVDSGGPNSVHINVTGNDMIGAARSHSIYAFGPGIVVTDIGNQKDKDLTNWAEAGASIAGFGVTERGGASVDANLTVHGTLSSVAAVTAPAFNFPSARSEAFNIPGLAFNDSSTVMTQHTPSGRVYFSSASLAGAKAYMVAPVVIPVSATITGLECNLLAAGPGDGARVTLWRTNNNGTATSVGSATATLRAGLQVVNATFSESSDSTRAYYVEAALTNGTAGSSASHLTINQCSVKYTRNAL